MGHRFASTDRLCPAQMSDIAHRLRHPRENPAFDPSRTIYRHRHGRKDSGCLLNGWSGTVETSAAGNIGVIHVNQEIIVERLFGSLISGDRRESRSIVREVISAGFSAEQLTHEVYWPTLEMINNLFRNDQLTTLAHHYATRLMRSLIDQAQIGYSQNSRRDKSVVMFSGPNEADALAGVIVAVIIVADGYDVFFGGGGIANDGILAEVGERGPDILLMFASAPSDAPNIRQLIDTIRGINSCPHMQIVVGGGVFNRAPGLAEEIGADLWARDPRELIDQLADGTARRATAEQRTVGRNRKLTRAPQAA